MIFIVSNVYFTTMTKINKNNDVCVCVSCSVASNSLQPLSMGFSRQKTGVGCHFLLQMMYLIKTKLKKYYC